MFNKFITVILPIFPKSFVKIFAKRYVAGEQLSDAVRVVKELNEKGIVTTIDVLGEDISEKSEALQAVENCKEVLHTINKFKLNSNLSIKLTQLGLKIDKEFCYDNVKILLDIAKGFNNFIRIDMEDSTCTTDTIDVFKRLRKEYDNVGIVVQAYMKRNINDVTELMKIATNFRLCKGIYNEHKSIAYKEHNEINQNFMKTLNLMLNSHTYVGIATHDDYLVDESYKLIENLKLKKEQYEFQMLLGVRPELRDKIVRDGHPVRVYVPFGVHWYAYSTRRLKENPRMAGYIIKALFFKG
jgi:proline dehydrogenase